MVLFWREIIVHYMMLNGIAVTRARVVKERQPAFSIDSLYGHVMTQSWCIKLHKNKRLSACAPKGVGVCACP